MLNDSTHIINNVPGRHLHPMLLAESQAANLTGYIMVAYNTEPRQFDLLFVEGRTIIDCARMNRDLRFRIGQDAVVSAFRDGLERAAIHLFACSTESLKRFTATLDAEPCLKVHVDALSRKQLQTLVHATGCRKGIIERNIFTGDIPAIELQDLDSASLPSFAVGLKNGRLLVYDLLRNSEVQRFIDPVPRPITRRPRRKPVRTPESESTPRQEEPVSSENDSPAETVEKLVKQLLPADEPEAVSTAPVEATPQQEPDQPQMNHQQSTDAHALPEPQPPQGAAGPDPADEKAVQAAVEETSQQLLGRTMERMLRAFRQQVVDITPRSAASIFAQAEKNVMMYNPECNLQLLDDAHATLALELVEEMVKAAPLLKRSKLRERAAELVADLYHKHYDLLDRHNTIDAVEQCYYRLKGSKA